MAKIKNKDIVLMGLNRFWRTAVALVLGVLITVAIDTLSGLDISPEVNTIIAAIVIPGLAALNKIGREKGWWLIGI